MATTPTALITGATGGLGQALCREFLRHGYNLVLTARNPAKLQELAQSLRGCHDARITVIAADLNQNDAPRRLFEKTQAAGITVDVLVNNAGFGLGGAFVRDRVRALDAMVRVNVLAPTRLCRLFLPGMLERHRGGILNIASTGALVPGPYNAVYCASKAYLLSLTEALSVELRRSPVAVTAVCPGATRTNFAHRAGMETTRLFTYLVLEPRQVACAAMRAFQARRPVAVVGPQNKAVALALRMTPRRLAARLSGSMQRPGAVRARTCGK